MALWHALSEGFPIQVGFSAAGESDEIDEYRVGSSLIVVRWKIDTHFALRGITEQIPPQIR